MRLVFLQLQRKCWKAGPDSSGLVLLVIAYCHLQCRLMMHLQGHCICCKCWFQIAGSVLSVVAVEECLKDFVAVLAAPVSVGSRCFSDRFGDLLVCSQTHLGFFEVLWVYSSLKEAAMFQICVDSDFKLLSRHCHVDCSWFHNARRLCADRYKLCRPAGCHRCACGLICSMLR